MLKPNSAHRLKRPAAALLVTLALLAGAGRLRGAFITFEAAGPPVGQENFEHLWDITADNPTPNPTKVVFRVEARDAKAGSVFSASTQPVVLAPGQVRISAADIKLTEVWSRKGYEAFGAKGPALPEGDYTYIITLTPGLQQYAFFLRIRVPKPVELAWPPDRGVITDSQPVLVWGPPVTSGPIVPYRYGLRVVAVGRRQNAIAAINRNPPVFESGILSATACRLPAGSELVIGTTYAWRVTVTDTAGLPVDTVRSRSAPGTFVYRPGPGAAAGQTSFTYPHPERSLTGHASFVVQSAVPDADVCVLEYKLGTDSTGQEWQMVGTLPRKEQSSFVGMWASDSAVTRAGKTFPSQCVVRATVLGRKGESGQTAPLPLVINPPPPPDRRGCGCNNIPDE